LIEGAQGVSLYAGQLGSGDFSGDGRADLLIGSPYLTKSSTNEGRVYLIPGPLTGSTSVEDEDIVIYGDFTSTSYFGHQVASAGDTNGDGINEAMISAYASSAAGITYAGAVYFFEGSALTGSVSAAEADATLQGSDSSGYFGHDISGEHDVNGDGYDDVLIGAGYLTANGAAYVFLGPLDEVELDVSADTEIYPEESGNYFGWRVAMAGDLNDDGVDDIAFSELKSDYSLNNGGAVGLAFGPLSGSYTLENVDAVIYPETTDFLGHDIHGVGDISGDGVDDLAIGGMYTDTIWLFFGGSGL
jgi:hypothetical protein